MSLPTLIEARATKKYLEFQIKFQRQKVREYEQKDSEGKLGMYQGNVRALQHSHAVMKAYIYSREDMENNLV